MVDTTGHWAGRRVQPVIISPVVVIFIRSDVAPSGSRYSTIPRVTWYTLLRYADVPFGFLSPFHYCRFGVASRERVRPMIPLPILLQLKIVIHVDRKPKKPNKKK